MYSLSTTKQFEKDLKLCMKRGLPMDELKTISHFLLKVENYLRNISRISYQVFAQENGSVISNLIGC